jgi:hypothetical protein
MVSIVKKGLWRRKKKEKRREMRAGRSFRDGELGGPEGAAGASVRDEKVGQDSPNPNLQRQKPLLSTQIFFQHNPKR